MYISAFPFDFLFFSFIIILPPSLCPSYVLRYYVFWFYIFIFTRPLLLLGKQNKRQYYYSILSLQIRLLGLFNLVMFRALVEFDITCFRKRWDDDFRVAARWLPFYVEFWFASRQSVTTPPLLNDRLAGPSFWVLVVGCYVILHWRLLTAVATEYGELSVPRNTLSENETKRLLLLNPQLSRSVPSVSAAKIRLHGKSVCVGKQPFLLSFLGAPSPLTICTCILPRHLDFQLFSSFGPGELLFVSADPRLHLFW